MEAIERLHERVARLAMAGAGMASGDGTLAAIAAHLEESRTPILVRLSERVRASTSGSAREFARLVAATEQVRCALAAPAEAGPSAALEAAPAPGSPCRSDDLYDVIETIRRWRRGSALSDALERGHVCDVRLLEALASALTTGPHGDALVTRVAPALGPGFGRLLRRTLNLAGDHVDGRRVRAIIVAERAGALDLARQALHSRSSTVRAGAMNGLADVWMLPGDVEPRVLQLVHEPGTGIEGAAAVRAIGVSASPGARAVLLDALTRESTCVAAAEAILLRGERPELEELAGRLFTNRTRVFDAAVEAACRLDGTLSVERLGRVLDPEWSGDAASPRMVAVLKRLGPTEDPRWPPRVLDRAFSGAHPQLELADALVAKYGPAAVRMMIDRLRAERNTMCAQLLIVALGRVGDRSAVDAILAAAAATDDAGILLSVETGMLALADAGAVPRVRALAAARKGAHDPLRRLLKELEKRFPGS